MSALAAILRHDAPSPRDDRDAVRTMLGAMRSLGADLQGVTPPLGVGRNAWELPGHEPSGVISGNGVHVAAVASIYYRDDLRRRLAQLGSIVSPAAGSAELIHAAYRALGPACVEHLEGDFAFVAWDESRRELFAARDFVGRHGLFYSRTDGALLLASTVGGLLSQPEVPAELSMASIATAAAGLWGHAHDTAYQAIAEFPAGHRLMADAAGAFRLERYWHPPARELSRRESRADASEHVRELLVRAVDERMSPSGPTASSLSGGWDSPAVFGAGHLALQRAPAGGRSLRPVSISYPPGDPGREDELIQAIIDRWGAATHWLHVDDVPIFLDPEQGAAKRDEPFAHAYEHWNRELSRGARQVGARVLLDGSGGDQLFQVSAVYMSDLFRRGRLSEFARQWRVRGAPGLKALYRATVRQAFPGFAATVARLRGTSAPMHYQHRDAPHWFRRGFLARHGVLERDIASRPAMNASTQTLAETQSFLMFPFFARISRMVTRFSLEEGVEQRSPLLDARLVAFAAPRPWHEKADRNETKIVLRRAMRGLLPDEVLAPRTHRTGVTSAYFLRQLRGAGRPFFDSLIASSKLVEVGMVEPVRLKQAWEHLLAHDDETVALQLFFTLQAELWLRTRLR